MEIGVNTRLMLEDYHTGIQNYIYNLYRTLKRTGSHQFSYLNPKSKKDIWQNAFYDAIAVVKDIHQANSNVYHSPHGVLPVMNTRASNIATVHDLGFKVYPYLCRRYELVYYNLVWQNLIRRAEIITVDSDAVKSEVIRYFPQVKNRLITVPLGVDPYFQIRETPEYLKKLKQKHNLENKKILFVSSAHAIRKNVKLVVQAISKIPGVFLVVGGTVDFGVFEEVGNVQLKERILIIKYLNKRDLRGFYQIADLFIYPSFYEGFGLPVLEAMASRCPVIASSIAPIREMGLGSDWLFDPFKVSQLREKINDYLSISHSQKSNLLAKYRPVIDHYSWENTAFQMNQIFSGQI